MDADVIVVGAGLAGLVATHELTSRGKRVALVDQENAANLGGQAFWSFGGLFLVDSPEQRRLGVRTPSNWPGTTGVAAPSSTASRTRTVGRCSGPAPTSSLRPVRNGRGCWATGSAFCRRWAGPSAVTCAPTATAIRCPGSTLPGVLAPVWSSRSSTRRWPPPTVGWSRSTTATGSTNSSSAADPPLASGVPCWPLTTHRVALRPTGMRWASSRLRLRR